MTFVKRYTVTEQSRKLGYEQAGKIVLKLRRPRSRTLRFLTLTVFLNTCIAIVSSQYDFTNNSVTVF